MYHETASEGLKLPKSSHPKIEGIRGEITAKALASIIDHTLLKADAPVTAVAKLCEEAKQHNFASVCVNSSMVSLAKSLVRDSDVSVCAVIGFPLGSGTTTSKLFETQDAIACGADEIDMVINVGALKSKDYAFVEEDIRRVVKAANGHIVKVILETCLLTREEIIIACALSKAAGAHFVKTSTGFSTGGAKVEDVALMREVVGDTVGVKASGGIRDTETAIAMVKAGASRLGVSSSVAIVTGAKAEKGDY